QVVDTVFAGLSPRSRYLRFHAPVPRLTSGMRRALLPVDGIRRIAVAAWCGDEPLGIARVTAIGDGAADVAVAVVDAWQRRGLGRRMLTAVTELAERAGITELQASVLPENVAMLSLVRTLYPTGRLHYDGDAVALRVPIGAAAATITEADVYESLLARPSPWLVGAPASDQ
ncbi:MAG: GNAT family N-acetyltransferase, partial [Pseudonocardia sp.]|nr:GNAT family N-acetyltransferase [Pseudonocardia sp.]